MSDSHHISLDDQSETRRTHEYFSSIQDEHGVDLTLIRENLKLSPIERLRKAERARRSALRLLDIGRKHRERRSKSA